MANLKVKCPICNKDVLVKKEFNNDVLKKRISLYECGHADSKPIEVSPTAEIEAITSKFRKHKPFKYQAETVQFLESAGLRGIVNHEMGLGKMVIECILLKRNFDKLTPALIICPAGITHQWFNHIIDWCEHIPQVLSSKEPNPDFNYHKIFIVSVDTLWRLPWMRTQEKVKGVYGYVDIDTPEKRKVRNTFQHICIDEVQKIKSNTAKRTVAVKGLGEGKKNVSLSGTPIKNNMAEYFPCLNMVLPDIFPTQTGFEARFVKFDYYGKPIGIKNEELFRDLTQDYITRFTREEKLPDLPKIFRQYQSSEIEDKDLQESYENELDGFLDMMDKVDESGHGPSMTDMTNILGYFARMRHITGLSKVQPTVDYVEQFLLETNRKITIFTHHKDVMEMIGIKLESTCKNAGFGAPLFIKSDMDSSQRMNTIEQFKQDGNRILIASTLAAGEGINLQFCSDCILVERQWNPANEEQAEARFPRPGSTADKVNANYMIAAGTIDEMLTELVERKRAIMQQVLDGKETKWDESSLMSELANELQRKGKSKWKASLL